MKKAFLRTHGKPAMEGIEEAFMLLRTASPALLATYYLGTIPFVAGLLIFCSSLSRRAEAANYLVEATLAMTVLFIWMKFFQARFGSMMLARLRGDELPSWRPVEIARSLAIQTTIHATGLILLPLSALALLPFGWVYAFYQNVSTLDDGRTRLADCFRASVRQSTLWPGENHLALLVLSGFGFFVFFNWIILGMMAPQLLNMFFGIESVFTQSPMSMINTTFLAATVALTYLSVDPLMKTYYLLRCFQGGSVQSGDDLRSEVRRLSGRTAALALMLMCCLPLTPAQAESTAPKTATSGESLNTSIETVVQQSKYTWRTPREKAPKTKNGWFTDFFKSISEAAERVARSVGEFLQKILDWLFPKDRKSADGSLFNWGSPQAGILAVILALVVVTLTTVLIRMMQTRREAEVTALAVAIDPDLENESTGADELPEDDWTKMGRRLLEEGDLRRALRAFYLASLAHLASRGLITIARWKSNRDYERELKRRGHSTPELPILFGENVSIFDRIWYGLHEASPEMVQKFVTNLERMKTAA